MKTTFKSILIALGLVVNAAIAAPVTVQKLENPVSPILVDYVFYADLPSGSPLPPGASTPGPYVETDFWSSWDPRSIDGGPAQWTFCAQPLVDDSAAGFTPGTFALFNGSAVNNDSLLNLYQIFYNTLPVGAYTGTNPNPTQAQKIDIAAFQTMVWELIIDGASPNLLAGNVKLDGNPLDADTQAVYDRASQMLAAVNAAGRPSGAGLLTYYEGAQGGSPNQRTAQGFLSFDVPVPVPAPFALLALGLVATMIQRRK